MKELYEFRIDEREAHRLFAASEGHKVSDDVRNITIAPDDERFEDIGRLRRTLWNAATPQLGSPFFFSWNVVREYSPSELDEATVFSFLPLHYFGPSGEECGTVYDTLRACNLCGAGAKQVSTLCLDGRRIPKGCQIASTVGGEVVISRILSDKIRENDAASGVEFLPIEDRRTGEPIFEWLQLRIHNFCADIVAPTRTGINPFDDDNAGEFRCECGDTIGLNLLTEITANIGECVGLHFLSTRQFLGRRSGILRPLPAMLITQRARHILEVMALGDFRLEVVHV